MTLKTNILLTFISCSIMVCQALLLRPKAKVHDAAQLTVTAVTAIHRLHKLCRYLDSAQFTVATRTSAISLVSGHCAGHAAQPLYRGIALVMPPSPCIGGSALVMPHRPCIGGSALIMPPRPCIGGSALVTGAPPLYRCVVKNWNIES
jgi:hypothetical protein